MYKKVWLYILIIVVVSSLFPSIILVKADEGEGEGEIPDIEYSLQNAPFPGNYGKINEVNWQEFIDRAEALGHTTIKKLVSYTHYYEQGGPIPDKTETIEYPLYYSSRDTQDTDIEIIIHDLDNFNHNGLLIRYKNPENKNILTHKGLMNVYEDPNSEILISVSGGYINWKEGGKEYFTVNGSYYSELWYSAEIDTDPYQELPEQYNIDPENGYGMYFIKPKQGEMITIPYKNQAIRDSLEIEIVVPQFYLPSDGLIEMLYEIKGEVGKLIWPNFVIRLYSNNVSKIWGSKSPNDASDWILQHNIEFVQGYYDEDGYMYAAKFKAKIPIDHEVPKDEGSSLIVADLYIDYSNNAWDRQEYRLEDARTWVRYLTAVGVVDEDGDGIDDRTGLPIYDFSPSPIDEHGLDKPDIEDYDNTILGRLSYYWDSLVYYVKLPFYYIRIGIEGIIEWISNIGTFIESFTSIFDRLFSFLPSEVTAMLVLGFSTMMIITIVRAIRGS